MKRFFAIILTICLLVMALPVTTGAQSAEHNALIKQINNCYYRAKADLGTSSLEDMCGNFVAYQLYYLGITDYAQSYNGSRFYNEYAKLESTSGGHNLNFYPAGQYTLEQALNAISHNGTKNVYNIMLCFDWTIPGGGFGHVMLIHAIINGVVYGVDNFTTSIAGAEGRPMIAPIARFVREYAGWSTFEGAVEFGTKEFSYSCPSYATNMFIRMNEPGALLSQPAPVGSNESVAIREIAQGERLTATHLVVGQDRVNYYCVREGGNDYYIPAASTQPILVNTEGLQSRDISFTSVLASGEKGALTGELYSTGCLIAKVELVVTDAEGKQVYHRQHQKPRLDHNLANLDVDFSELSEGVYHVKLYATLWNYYDGDGVLKRQNRRALALEETLLVGDVQPQQQQESTIDVAKRGWFYENGAWRCYRNGEPRTGWYCYDGVDYYLQEDGAVTTGWANINGEDRFFSDTGAMRTGWLTEDNGNVRYMLFNGISAKGWRNIQGTDYYFDENGILIEDAIPES